MIATAPEGPQEARDLLWRSALDRPLIAWPLHELKSVDALGFCGLVAPLRRMDAAHKVLHSEAPSGYNQFLVAPDNSWFKALAMLCDTPIFSQWIIVIDATLPLVTAATVRAGLQAAQRTGVSCAAEPLKETLKRVAGVAVVETLPRESLRRLLTPMVFKREALQRVLDRYISSIPTSDDLGALTQLAGAPLTVFDAGYPAVRVTSEDDLAIVETLLRQRESEASPS